MQTKNQLQPIYTEKTECRDCYKCVRACPVKAIQVRNGSAVVMHERCIFCGKCVDVCPSHAKKIRSDIAKAKALVAQRSKVFVSLAPSYAAEFYNQEPALFAALNRLGFSGISETALGAAEVSKAVDVLLQGNLQHSLISSACPTVVETIKKYFPELKTLVTPLPSPLRYHAVMLRKLYGADIGIVFIGPCIAKKLEADRSPGYPDVALTFAELKDWLRSEGLSLQAITQELKSKGAAEISGLPEGKFFEEGVLQAGFIPHKAGEASLYAVEGGMVASLKKGKELFQSSAIGLSGIQQVLQVLDSNAHREKTRAFIQKVEQDSFSSVARPREKEVPEEEAFAFLELLSCEGGCVNGPGCSSEASPAQKKCMQLAFTRKRVLEAVSAAEQKPHSQKTELTKASLEKTPVSYSSNEMRELAQASWLQSGGSEYEPTPGVAAREEASGVFHAVVPQSINAAGRGVFSEIEIAKALRTLGKQDLREQLDCGGCGYNSCRDFAAAYISGMAEAEMCVTKMRKQAQRKMDMLLKTLPMGVVIVDEQLSIVECNAEFLSLFMTGEDFSADEGVLEKVIGTRVAKYIPLSDKLSQLFSSKNPVEQYRAQHRVENREQYLKVTFFIIEKGRLAGALFQDITTPTVRRETVIKKAEAVIKKNLESVQQIASLLGENAAETEIMLSSVIEAFQVPQQGGDTPQGRWRPE